MKLSFSGKIVRFFLIGQTIFVIVFFFILYPFMGLSLILAVKGMGPAVLLIFIITGIAAIGMKKMLNPAEQILKKDIVTDDDKSLVLKIEKKLSKLIVYLDFVVFPGGMILGVIITLFIEGFLRWSTFRIGIVGGLIGPTFGILLINYANTILKEVKVKVNIYETKSSKVKFPLTMKFFLSMMLIGILFGTILFLITVTREEKLAGISNVAIHIRKNYKVEKNKGAIIDLINLSLKSDDPQVKNQAQVIMNNWNKFSQTSTLKEIGMLIFLLSLFGIFVYVLSVNFSSNIISINKKMEKIVDMEGDLTQMIVKTSNNEIGELQALINRHIASLNKIFSTFFDIAMLIIEKTLNQQNNMQLLVSSNEEISALSKNMIEEFNKQTKVVKQTREVAENFVKTVKDNIEVITGQSSMIEESGASITQMHSSIASVSNATLNAFELGKELEASARTSSDSIEQMMESIDEISKMGNNISEIVSTISSIADQTDILAMNAAIEAAHAGKAGKGFAVVADEIRKLAENTSEQTTMISSLLTGMSSNLEKMVDKSEIVSESMGKMNNKITATIDVINEINYAAKEQLLSADETLKSIQGLVEITSVIMENLEKQTEMNDKLSDSMVSLENSTDITRGSGMKQIEYFNNLNENFNAFHDYFQIIDEKANLLHSSLKRIKLKK